MGVREREIKTEINTAVTIVTANFSENTTYDPPKKNQRDKIATRQNVIDRTVKVISFDHLKTPPTLFLPISTCLVMLFKDNDGIID